MTKSTGFSWISAVALCALAMPNNQPSHHHRVWEEMALVRICLNFYKSPHLSISHKWHEMPCKFRTPPANHFFVASKWSNTIESSVLICCHTRKLVLCVHLVNVCGSWIRWRNSHCNAPMIAFNGILQFWVVSDTSADLGFTPGWHPDRGSQSIVTDAKRKCCNGVA